MKVAHFFIVSTMISAASSFASLATTRSTYAYAPAVAGSCSSSRGAATTTSNSALFMAGESDFDSAMPSKPEIPMREKLQQTAKEFSESIRSNLGEGVEAPPELLDLEKLGETGGDEKTVSVSIYTLMIEQGMLYDQDPDTGTLTPTEYDVPSNLDVPEVQKEFSYLYTYGMNLIKSGLIDIDTMKEVVKDRLIVRTGLTPEAFDEWLGY